MKTFILILLLSLSMPATAADLAEIQARVEPPLKTELSHKNIDWGSPLYLRSFKKTKGEENSKKRNNYNEAIVEVWIKNKNRSYELLRSYTVCTYSGALGPKQKDGDRQSPEGFYSMERDSFQSESQYHLSMNIGYPNVYDKMHGYTGNLIMIHGNCFSEGCLSLGERNKSNNINIEELFLLAMAAIKNGQKSIPVHQFPFPMTEENFERYKNSPWQNFWRELKPAYDYFEKEKIPPQMEVKRGHYVMISSEAGLTEEENK